MKNNICERIIAHWNEIGEILPEIRSLSEGEVDEIIDGIHVDEKELIAALHAFQVCCL